MAHRTILFDLSDVNVHAPSYQDMKPGQALDARASAKVSKNGHYSHEQGCTFVPFILDQFGSLGPEALQLLKDQIDRFLTGFFAPLRAANLVFENARIVVQWLTMARDKHVRHIVFS
jgi:hypothetical protein